jgi:hypothetical protein
MRANELIIENLSHPCIVVDVQPAYKEWSKGKFEKIINFVNHQTGPVLMFVNAEKDSLTDDTVRDIIAYWDEVVLGPDFNYDSDMEPNEINWNRFTIVDKGFGYLRSWLDYEISPAIIIKTIRLMYQQRVDDSTMLFGGSDSPNYTEDFEKFIGSKCTNWMRHDGIFVNWLRIGLLKKFNGAYIMGGGRNECLREVELMMNAFNISYKRIESLIY